MKLLPFRESRPKQRRRTRKSRKWIDKAKAEVRSIQATAVILNPRTNTVNGFMNTKAQLR